MKYNWIDLPEKKNCFTTRNTVLLNLNTGEIVQYYSANTKIVVVQKCITTKGTFYRTENAVYNYLNHAFKADALGLPNEIAPPRSTSFTNSLNSADSPTAENFTIHKQQADTVLPSGGEATPRKLPWYKRLFR